MKKLIAIGRILRPWGNKGELKISLFSGKVGSLESFTKICAGDSEKSVIQIFPEKERRYQDGIIVKFLGVHSIVDADALRGKYLYVKAEELAPLARDEYYIDDLIGLKVILTKKGKELGYVVNVLETHGTDLVEIQKGKRNILIPLTKSICKMIDLRNKILIIDPPEGLLDLNEV